jgi:maltooligosyltrehalose trehalohydrolase
VPNPQDEQTFLQSKLNWAERDTPRHQEMLAWYTELIALRRAWPELTDPRLDRMRADYDEEQRWLVLHRGRLRLVASLGEQPLLLPLGAPGTAVLAATSSGVSIEGEQLSMPPASFAVVAT